MQDSESQKLQGACHVGDVRGAPVSNSPSWAGLGCSFVLAARDQMDGWRAAEAGIGWRSDPLDIYSSLILALEV